MQLLVSIYVLCAWCKVEDSAAYSMLQQYIVKLTIGNQDLAGFPYKRVNSETIQQQHINSNLLNNRIPLTEELSNEILPPLLNTNSEQRVK